MLEGENPAVGIAMLHEGRLLALDELRPGACFGELGVLTGRVRSACAQARVHELIFARPRVDQHDVGVAVLPQLERLARAHGHHVGVGPELAFKIGQNHIQ